MNKYCLLFVVVFFYKICCGQNLVPNESFEVLLNCPTVASVSCGWTFYDELAFCTPNWQNVGCGSGDYFNACSSGPVGVPNNTIGYQFARTGDAYAGIIVYPPGYNEYVGTFLTDSLTGGVKYYVRFYVCNEPNFFSNVFNKSDALCALFTNGLPDTTGSMINPISMGSIPLSAQINNPDGFFLSDTLNWIEVSGSFIATGGENFLTIGNFKDTSIAHGMGYYYVDDVCVSIDSLTCFSSTELNQIKNESDIILFPNPITDELSSTTKTNDFKQIILYDITSRKILQQQFTSSVTLNTAQLSKGIYIYEVRDKNGLIKKGKVIKE